MQVEEDTDAPACLSTAEFLSAEELVSLRKPTEETPQPVIGEKFYTVANSELEEKELKYALEGYKGTLDKKRAGRICDLMQAEWDPELNVVKVSKLKGKFTQHMGRLANGKHILAPEEAAFLLENNCIEIMCGETPMSTEEAFSKILKGNLAHDKYQTYSHLSKLGYIVVMHPTQAGVTENEKEINVNNYPLKKRKYPKEPAEGEPEKKRLTFTGALSGESEMNTASEASKENSATVSGNETNRVCSTTSTEETGTLEVNEHGIAEQTSVIVKNMHFNAEEQNGAMIDKVTEDIQSDLDKINHTPVKNRESEAKPETKDIEVSKEISSACDYKSVEGNENATQSEEISKSNGVDSQNLNELAKNNKLQNDPPLKNVENQDFLDSNSQSSKIVDVMDVDTDAEISCSTSEVSRDNVSTFDSNVNATSQDSCISVNNDDNTEGGANGDSNFDVLSMSYSSEDEDKEVLTIDAGSADNLLREEDDDVTLLEVTKKETKPLAVIDLLSDDDDQVESIDVDDDITVLDEYPSSSRTRPTSLTEMQSKKMMGCKKEEESSVVSSSKSIPPLTVQFPDLFKKRVVCVARPPLHLLPNHVKPSKEAYVLNLAPKNSDQPSMSNRVWNSYRDMQDYQRQRRQNRYQNNPRAFPGLQTWNDRNSSNHERYHRPGFGPDRVNSPDVTSNSRNVLRPPVDFSRNSYPEYSSQNSVPLPNPATMNCEVTIKEDASESMVSSSSQSSHSNNFSFSSGMPDVPLMNPMIPNTNFMAGMQRNAYSNMGNVSNHFMAELQRTCFTVATNMLTSMLNRNSPMMPNPAMPMVDLVMPPPLNPPGPFNPNVSNGFNSSFNPPSGNEYFSMPPQNFSDQPRRFHRGRPFPCRYRNIGNKQSWRDVRSAVRGSSSDSDIEEMPISPREILWDNKDICPLVKPGVHYPIGSIIKFLQVTQKAKVTNKYRYSEKLLPSGTNLEISFDVYTPGFTYKKTCPQIPKYRIVVVRSTDPCPKYSDLVILQRKWNDGAAVLLAVNDHGNTSFQSFNSISLPLITPYED